MSGGGASDRERPLARWSRLKRARTADPMPPAPVDGEGTGDVPASRATGPASPGPPDLPDPESLGRDGDYTRFLQPDVPDVLRQRALRALWRSDPVLANLDGLNDYDEDMSRVGAVGEVVRTAWRVGRGYLDEAPPASDVAATDREQTEAEAMTPDVDAADCPEPAGSDDVVASGADAAGASGTANGEAVASVSVDPPGERRS